MLRNIAMVACLLTFLLSPAAQAFDPQPEKPVPQFEDLFKIPLLSPTDHWCCPLPWWLPPGQAIMQSADVARVDALRK